MIERLPQYAERKFALLCSAAGARAHKAEEDEGGWDYLVELPAIASRGPADTHPPARVVYVQVKSKKRGRLSCTVKLSNALKAAQSRQPWFMVLILARADGNSVNVYARHLWSEDMARTLERVRRAENAARPLHKETITIAFDSEDDRGEELVSWMQDCISAYGDNYEETKKKLHQNLGFEESSGTGQVTIEAASADEIAEGFLGLGDGLKLTKFTYTGSRFGIPDTSPQVDTNEEGRLVITPNPVGECEVRIRSSYGSVVLPGKVYSFALPGVPPDQRRLRFSAGFLNVICTGVSAKLNYSLGVGLQDSLDLQTLSNFCSVRAWMGKGQLEIQIWTKGRRVLRSDLDAQLSEDSRWWFQLSSFVDLMCRIAGSAEPPIKLTLEEVAEAVRRCRLFHLLSDAASLAIECELIGDEHGNPVAAISWAEMRVGSWGFYVLTRRNIESCEALENGRYRLICGKAVFVDAYALQDPADDQTGLLKADYDRYVAKCDAHENVVTFGDMVAFARAAAQRSDADQSPQLPGARATK